ncbi:MAG TPA: NUDIX hydrolase [Pyrinomonadaceae bacterium]|jgi:8-oxo-dGTP pyrophosphatase MutT (NUDIX family)
MKTIAGSQVRPGVSVPGARLSAHHRSPGDRFGTAKSRRGIIYTSTRFFVTVTIEMAQLITRTQVSAGGVAFRRRAAEIEVALISVGADSRWQLPKGLVDDGEEPEATALREVREEAGLRTELLAPIEKIEYWYVSTTRGERVRFHKFVHFFLLRYRSGSVRDHDHEVNEARWVEIEAARGMLAFKGERQVVERARQMILALPAEADSGEPED